MSEYQITYWRDLPSLVAAREGDEVAKIELPPGSRSGSTRSRWTRA